MSRRHPCIDAVREIAAAAGADITVTHGKHFRIGIAYAGQRRVISTSKTPSCRFAHEHAAGDARRALKAMGARLS